MTVLRLCILRVMIVVYLYLGLPLLIKDYSKSLGIILSMTLGRQIKLYSILTPVLSG